MAQWIGKVQATQFQTTSFGPDDWFRTFYCEWRIETKFSLTTHDTLNMFQQWSSDSCGTVNDECHWQVSEHRVIYRAMDGSAAERRNSLRHMHVLLSNDWVVSNG